MKLTVIYKQIPPTARQLEAEKRVSQMWMRKAAEYILREKGKKEKAEPKKTV